jgi:threonine/homoserine/homoserine lactone efflux protein
MFPDASTYAVFMAAALALLLIPGPAVMYIVARAIDQGRVAGVVSALGLGVGTLFHVVAAALGLSAVLASSAIAFSAVKYVGAVYLVFLGVRRLMNDRSEGDVRVESQSLRRIFGEGVVVNILNPKTALFFVAFLPQFVRPGRGSVTGQLLVLGLSFVLLGIVTDGLYGLATGSLGGVLKNDRRFRAVQRYLAGVVFITLGVGSALAGSGRK